MTLNLKTEKSITGKYYSCMTSIKVNYTVVLWVLGEIYHK